MNKFYGIICRIVLLSGLHILVRQLISKHKITFILYHSPDPATFRSHVQYLVKKYTIISLQEFMAYQNNSSIQLPPHSLVITFDDGHRTNFDLLQTVKEFNIRPTFYICSSIVGTYRKFWFKLDGIDVRQLKNMDHARRLELLKTHQHFRVENEFDEQERQALSTDELEKMKRLVDFESHTCFHPILSTCEAETAQREITKSKQELELRTGKSIYHFAYPNGDYTEREITFLKQSGYQSARTTDVGWNSRSTDPFRLKITGVNDHASLWMLKAELTGIPAYFYNLYTSGISWKSIKGLHIAERKIKYENSNSLQ